MLLEEARLQVTEMQRTVNQLRIKYGELKKKIESVSDTLLAISEAQKEHGEVTEEKAKNLIALYGALLTMNEKCGADGPKTINNASYVVYAYLGGQAKREQIFVTEKE